MKHKNLKKLMFLMVLMLGVGQAAQAAKVKEEISLDEITYWAKEGDIWKGDNADWNLNTSANTIYGRGSTVPTNYAELNDYDELRIYQTEGDPVRLFFFNDKSDDYVTGATPEGDYYYTLYPSSDAAATIGEEYISVNLKVIKEKFGFAKLIAIKASAYDTNATVEKITAVNYKRLTFNNAGQAFIFPEDMEATGMEIDPETGLLTKSEIGDANILIDLIDVDFRDVTRIDVSVDTNKDNGYSDILTSTAVRSFTEDINTWYASKYGIDYAANNYQERSEHIKEIQLYANADMSGQMKINYICITKNVVKEPVKLNFDNSGKAYIYPIDMEVTGMALDPETGILHKATAGNFNILVNLGDVDFRDVTRIDVSMDTIKNNGYSDIIATTVVRNQTEDINTWYGSKYGIDYTASNYQERSEHIKEIQLNADYSTIGKMKINSICITKSSVVSAMSSGETSLRDLDYLESKDEATTEFQNKHFEPNNDLAAWNINVNNELFYGVRWNLQSQQSYVDLNNYDELRIYMSNDGVQLRCFFIEDFFNPNNLNDGRNVCVKYISANDEGKDYATIDLAEVKAECGNNAYLISILTASGTSTVHDITVYQKGINYVLSGKGVLSTEAEAALADANATAIDATGLTNTEAITLESANPNCLFIVSDAAKLANAKNVLVKGEDGTYACANLELTPGYPFRAPYEFTATSASMTKTISNQFATLVLPYEATVPTECEAYTLTGVENDVVTGTKVDAISANTPILLANAGEYDFNAENVTVPVTSTEPMNGLLTGVYSATQAPTNSYVLQTQNGEQAFYHATEGNEPTMSPFTAYLTYTASNNANKLIFNLGGEVTSIENVEAATSTATVVEIYDLSGRQVSTPVKGINLMKMSDGTVKKVIVK